ncbi:MAG TPA: YeeE/YedE family protein [Minicystis sp.]|nr:YeeE/YedE family protein [Minicystis sp.]
MKRARPLAAFAAGLLFAIGLGVSGMTEPAKVLGFLDVGGAWDPSLACVMAGALAVSVVAFPRIFRRARPVLDARFHLPSATRVDARLVVGALVFGVGWGLMGFCPGPAIVDAAASATALGFVAAMAAGMVLVARLDPRAPR